MQLNSNARYKESAIAHMAGHVKNTIQFNFLDERHISSPFPLTCPERLPGTDACDF